jgi:hypothetical protein
MGIYALEHGANLQSSIASRFSCCPNGLVDQYKAAIALSGHTVRLLQKWTFAEVAMMHSKH